MHVAAPGLSHALMSFIATEDLGITHLLEPLLKAKIGLAPEGQAPTPDGPLRGHPSKE